MDRRLFCQTTVSAALLAATGARAADDFPSHPVRVIVSWAAGGGPDVQMRRFGVKLGETLGQSIIVENKVGAAGVLGAQYTAQQPADGYTLLLGSNAHLVQKLLTPSLKFDPIAEFVPVGNMATSPHIVVVRADAPYRTLQDLIAAAKARPGQLNYSSGGVGSGAHLAAATMVALAEMKVVHIPLKGSVEILASIMRGDTEFSLPISGTGVPHVKGGKLRALAVTSSERLKELPDVPTLHEVLRNDLAVQGSWFGLWAPVATPAPVVAKLHVAINKAVTDPSIVSMFESTGSTAAPSASPQAYATFVQNESRKWAEIIKLTGASAG